ncbi:MAG: NHLP bacteriocin export ABC transporter permease/ATPase subunit [Alphaproteobacteria bacterium]|nr:NHLP bacteriocin export ABC transporter permease/ATPase subunit [Alphaproteobacteria bacterium]
MPARSQTPVLDPVIRDRIESEGETLLLESGAAHVFADASSVWFIQQGTIELFAIQRRDGMQTGPREHLCTLSAGGLIWGISQDPDHDGIHLLALANGDCRLSGIAVASLKLWGRRNTLTLPLADCIDSWIEGLSSGVAKSITPRSQPRRSIAAGQNLCVAEADRIVSHRGVTWAQLGPGIAFYIDIQAVGSEDGTILVPLTPQGWLRAGGVRALKGMATTDILHADRISLRMNAFHQWVLHNLAFGFRDVASVENARLTRRALQLTSDTKATFFGFAKLMDPAIRRGAAPVGGDCLFECCRAIGAASDITFTRPPMAKWRRIEDPAMSAEDIAAASQVRMRSVSMPPGWWQQDGGPLLAFRKDDGAPVALLRKSAAVTIMLDPATATEVVVTEAVAQTLAPLAWSFYAGLPDHPADLLDLMRLCFKPCKADLLAIAMAGALGGLVATVIPLATGYVFDSVIPGHHSMEMLQVGAAIITAAFAAAAFEFSRSIAQLRVEGRIAGIAQAAIMDRLLRLPAVFFGEYSAGDLAQRTMVIEIARKSLTGIVTASLVSGAFSVFSFGLLIGYSPIAALVTGSLILILAAVTLAAGLRLMTVTARVQDVSGRISGLLLEIITGITKLRVAGAEERAFNNWGDDFSKLQAGELHSKRIHNRFLVFWSAFEIVGPGCIFATIGLISQAGMSTGTFLAFVAAFTGLMASLFALSKSVITVFSVVPLYRRAAPIMQTVPETTATKADPGRLSGALELNTVSFRYTPNAPFALHGLSLTVRPGELIAVVGPSGSGKSTLMRLLLGIGQPESGAVYYDGRDLRGLNVRSVRRQIGVVMQNGRLMPGSLYENIKGATRADIDECWDIAARVGLADDIMAMPMGMHTLLTDGTSTLSGGQVQRMLIARALVGKPALLLLDEATSALDNKTQAVVMRNLDHLSVTRIVIAHRLSTVINADRIYVLTDGRIVESGSYQQLMDNNGVFSTFAYRQNL